MKALVLGGTGPTGPTIVEGLLERGYEVTIMHSGQHEIEFSQPVEHIHGDVHFAETLEEALGARKFNLVVAAYGRLKVVAEVMVGRTERMVSIGGSNAGRFDPVQPDGYGRWIGRLGADPEKDRFPYQMHQAEQHLLEHHRAGHYIATHVRYPMVYGPRQLASVDWSIVRRILDGRRQLIIADDGLKLESRVFVLNAAKGILLAIDQPEIAGGKVYIVSDEMVLTLRERVELMCKTLNHEFELISMPHDLARPFHPFCRGRDHWLLDISKIKNELGYRDAVPAEEAVAISARWLAENRPEPGGELETQLGDPFDYAAEDAIIQAAQAGRAAIMAVPFGDYVPAHPYRHPKRPNEVWARPERWRGFRPS